MSLFQDDIRDALESGESRTFLHGVPTPDVLQKLAGDAAQYGLHLSVFHGHQAEFEQGAFTDLDITTDDDHPMVELVWHWPGETPSLDEDNETEDDLPYWQNPEDQTKGVVFTGKTPVLIAA